MQESLDPTLLAGTAESPPQKRIIPLLLFFAALGLVGYFVFSAVDRVIDRSTVDTRVANLRAEIEDLEWQAEQLSALVAHLDSDEYIERIAREELGFVRPGQEAFAIEAPLRPGLQILRFPWWANLLPESAGSFD